MIGIHGKHPLRITQQNSDPGTKPTAQMFPIKKFASSLNGKFQLCFSFKFLFDPSGGKKKTKQQMPGNEEPPVLPNTKLPIRDVPAGARAHILQGGKGCQAPGGSFFF